MRKPKNNPDALSEKQRRFVAERLRDPDAPAGEAYIKAGYKAKNRNVADASAFQLLRTTKIQSALAKSRKERSRRTDITSDKALREVAAIAFSDIGDILDFTNGTPRLKPASEIPRHARRAISSMKIKREVEGKGDHAQEVEVIEFRFWNKNDALDKLMKHLGMFVDKHEVSGQIEHKHVHAHFDVEVLPLALRIQILEHLEKADQDGHANQPAPNGTAEVLPLPGVRDGTEGTSGQDSGHVPALPCVPPQEIDAPAPS